MILERLFGKTADKATKDHPGAREAGMIGGSALIGGAVGLSTLGAAENLDKGRREIKHKMVQRQQKKAAKLTKKALAIENPELRQRSLELIKENKRSSVDKINKVGKSLKRITKPVSKFAKTKGGKAALIGVPTAIIGGVTYASAKKKDKKNK